ncbi:class I SAM-dependent methyltransferase [Paenibacillus sp. OAS669]|uniref:class I SAM-dependent methyltransferase n=1 Tax=Paenibacillus sp. OAS669 TaxID=2663821 RepID=UPI00178B2BA2|nr:class I SAM-dependent methyltransferase [Paenibacillus sp. OAS669]MBE1446916.1 ubiquinone/menaquinone biosynthesis C-methylase UbiE [Paenibacillus sp. OAS669]
MAQYDSFAEQYRQMVQTGGPEPAYRYIIRQLEALTDLKGRSLCDIGCGQGELSSRLAQLGALVTGVDLSGALLTYAKEKNDQVNWIQDDAMELRRLPDAAYDYVVSSVMLMDVPDHRKVFRACHRILKPEGIMIWVIMHPCFQSPFSHPLGDGSRKVMQYAPQFWKSAGTGTIRSTLGAYHRPLSAYINDFMSAGFSLLRVDEPERPDTSVDQLPSLFAAVGQKLSNP